MKISVIIPTFNESSTIVAALSNLAHHHEADEVIVCDGGSTDETVALAQPYAKVVFSEKGRAKQLNGGACAATGDVFLFLHADTILPENGLRLIKECLNDRFCESGRFRLRFDRQDRLLRFFQAYTCFHCFSYGDQGFFVRRTLFERLGGFREEVPFEDIDFYRRLRKVAQPRILKAAVTTSARRFSQVGSMKQKFINIFLLGLYGLGFNVFPLKQKLYQDVR